MASNNHNVFVLIKKSNSLELNTVATRNLNENETDALIELQILPVITIENFTSKEELLNKITNEQFKSHKNLIFQIEESLNQNDIFIDLNNDLETHHVFAFQSITDGKFSMLWRFKNEIFGLKMFDDINKEDLEELCKFIVEFLAKCLEQNHSGVVVNSQDKLNLSFSHLTDTNKLNLLFHAAQIGDTKVVKILLDVAFSVTYLHNDLMAIDYAYKNQKFETVLELLKLNSPFPELAIDECSQDLKDFIEMTEIFHKNLEDENIEEISQILTQHPNLRYFYNLNNRSAASEAIRNKKFDVYELFVSKNIYLATWEEMDKITVGFTNEELNKLGEIHFHSKKSIQESHITALMSKASVGSDVFDVQDKLDYIHKAFRVLNNFMAIQILFKIAALLSDLQIIFDFNRKSVEYLDPTQDRGTLGLFYGNGRIYVGAKQLLDPKTEHEVFATIAHEFCHFVLYNIFGKDAKPYDENDEKTAEEFETISQECKLKKSVDKIIKVVYECYKPEMFHAELIVRIPHFFAHYHNKAEVIELLRMEFKSLFDFYELNLMPKLEDALLKLKKKAEEEKREKDRKISMLKKALIIVFISMSSVAILIFCILYDSVYTPHTWENLSPEQKELIFNSKVKFDGHEMNFSYLFGRNESNEVFKVLKPQHFEKLLEKNEMLDLADAENEFLATGNYFHLIYGNTSSYLCCIFENYYALNRMMQTFIVNNGTLIYSNVTKVHSQYQSDEVEQFLILNSCIEGCEDNIKNLPISLSVIFPNLIAYSVQHFSVKHLKRHNFENLIKLLYLSLFDNLIEIIDENAFNDLVELKYLELNTNKIQFLDSQIFKNNLNLLFLSLSNNQIKNLNSLHFNNLVKLSYLYLSENNLNELDPNVLKNLVNLDYLSLFRNQFNLLKENIFKNLAKLNIIDLGENQLTTLNENIFNFNNKLEIIYLDNNRISSLNSSIFENKPNLYCVNLQLNVCINKEYGSRATLMGIEEKNQLKRDIEEYCSSNTALIDGKIEISKCCLWEENDFVINQHFQTFRVDYGTKILTNISTFHIKYKSYKTKQIYILSWCKNYDCNDKSYIKFLPIGTHEIFPNVIAYFAQHYEVKNLYYINFKKLKKIQYLNFRDNLIENIEENSFKYLRNLKYISLYQNKIKYLNSKIFENNLKLERLELTLNQITSLNFILSKNLKQLYLCNNNLTELDSNDFQFLINLEVLHLCGNQITSLPDNIFDNLLNLTYINLASNQLSMIDENIFTNNQKLENIELDSNEIRKLSIKTFDNKPNLIWINLKSNICIKLEFGVKKSIMKFKEEEKYRLQEEINKTCSNYKEFIDGLFYDTQCCLWKENESVIDQKLRTFYFSDGTKIHTDTAEVHSKYQNKNVKIVYINNNCVTVQCGSKQNVKYLPINVYKSFPNIIAYYAVSYSIKHVMRKHFEKLNYLQFFDLQDNLIDAIDEDSFDDLTELKYIIFAVNKIKYMSTRTFKNNLKLERINFSTNQIASITSEHFKYLKSLTYLSLCDNNLTEIELNMFDNLVKLEELYLCNNFLTSLPNNIFEKMTSLTIIHLANNHLITLDENIFNKNYNLNQIELSNNKISKLSSKIFDQNPNIISVDLRLNLCINKYYGMGKLYDKITQIQKKQLKQDINRNCS
ncbi:hypothetical protein PVAND_016340 [Polypedilum vanderplanki]|uniref:Uncharacterized protein n=1 Tax=Polypedilum vanderplanki TaxID=319348 RepID=A0A9J6BFK0_POLVA|nr:hypothetical protein PVAND_016340 [Polypedilum vanderplanki]